MSAVRLLVLGMLNGWGPMHGHQIRRQAISMQVERWGEVSVGSLYGALHRMEEEALVHAVRTEREGNLPSRTVFAVTEQGRAELATLLDRHLRTVSLGADGFDVALSACSAPVLDELAEVIVERKASLQRSRHELVERRETLQVCGRLSVRGAAIFQHWQRRIEAELSFHDDLELLLPDLIAEARTWDGPRSDTGSAPATAPPAERPRNLVETGPHGH
ncbi:MAG: PadR family transcriptional regulator [Candidatus Dormibacteria bacterium]